MRRFAFTAAMLLFTLNAFSQSSIPFYHQHADFLFSSPGSFDNGLLGYVNPANLNHVHGQDTRVMFASGNGNMRSIDHWGLFSAGPNFGFGLIQKDGATDYRIGLGFGDDAASLGMGYGWSRGNVKKSGHDKLITLGTLIRPNRYLSIGMSGLLGMNEKQREGIFDLAIRPAGSDMLTIFGEAAFQEKTQISDAAWSAGAVMQLLPGVHFTGRYFDTKTISAGLCFSFGTTDIRTQASFPEENDGDQLYYGIRIGAPKHSLFNTKKSQPGKYLSLNLKGTMTYQKFRLFDEGNKTLANILSHLDKAIHDPTVAGIALNLAEMNINREFVWEIREKLKEVQAANKKVVAHVERGGMTIYHLASVADRIVMDPEGLLNLEGYVMGRTFLKGTLEKLGLGYDEWRFFKYKSAAESLSRDSMTEADREQRQELLNDLYDVVKNDICSSREFDQERFDTIINNSFLMGAANALELGLVDTLARWKDMKDIVNIFEGGKKKKLIRANHLAGNVLPERNWGPAPKIALVYGVGECATESGINARLLEKTFDKLSKSHQIKAVVFRVDSPGGDGLASDLVAEAMKKCAEKKPVIVSQGRVAASGGYWISMNADTIVAAPHTITGSIGVIGGWIWDKTLGDKLGMTSDYVKIGNHADLGFGIRLPLLGLQVPDRNLSTDERVKVEELVREMYERFIEKVATGRGMETAAIEKVAQGRVWTGRDAKENGLVDVIGGLETAIILAKQAAGIPVDEKVDIEELPNMGLFKIGTISPKLMGISGGKTPIPDDYYLEYIRMIAKYQGQPLPILSPDMNLD